MNYEKEEYLGGAAAGSCGSPHRRPDGADNHELYGAWPRRHHSDAVKTNGSRHDLWRLLVSFYCKDSANRAKNQKKMYFLSYSHFYFVPLQRKI